MPVSKISEFANGQVCFTLGEFISILDIAGIELIDTSELDSIKHFAMKYLRERIESRRP
ncbi:MAG: hypothetical protein INH13_32740 [Cupriavidus sp.]|nr:hypothetical protein [Cupriavidus sp.]